MKHLRLLFALVLPVGLLSVGLLSLGLLAGPEARAAEEAERPDAPVEAAADAMVETALGAGPQTSLRFHASLAELLAGHGRLGDLRGLVEVAFHTAEVEGRLRYALLLHCDELRARDRVLGRLAVEARWSADTPTASIALSLTGDWVALQAKGSLDIRYDLNARALRWGRKELSLSLHAEWIDLAALSALLPGLDLSGRGSLDIARLRMTGRAADTRLEGLSVAGEGLRWRGVPLGNGRLTASLRSGRLQAALELGTAAPEVGTTAGDGAPAADAPPLHVSVAAALPVDVSLRAPRPRWRDREAIDMSWRLGTLTPERLAPFAGVPGRARFSLDIKGSAQGNLDALAFSSDLVGVVDDNAGEAIPVRGEIRGDRETQELTLTVGEEALKLSLGASLPLRKVLRRGLPLGAAELRGELTAALPLALLGPWLPFAVHAPDGLLAGRLTVGGDLGRPELTGALSTEGGALTLLGLNRRLHDVKMRLAFSGRRCALEALEGDGRPGRLAARGSVEFRPGELGDGGGLWGDWSLEAAAALSLEDFPVVQPALPLGTMTSEVDLACTVTPSEANVTVDLRSGELVLLDEKLPEARAIPESRALRRESGSAERLSPWRGRSTLRVTLHEPIAVRGAGVDVVVEGEMSVERTGENVHVDGGLDLRTGGSFQLFDNRFDIRAGRLSVAEGWLGRGAEAGPDENLGEAPAMAPAVNLVARAALKDTTVLVKLHGAATKPRLVLASVPALPEYQIMTLLITGRVDSVDTQDGSVRRRVAKMVERYHNPSLERQLYDRLGVDKLGLGFGSSVANPIVTVGRQMTRDLYVETVYHVDAPPDENEREGRVKYRLGSHWTIDTAFGDAAEGSLGVFWATSFGAPPPPEVDDERWGLEESARRRADDDGDGVRNAFDHCRREPEDSDGFEDEDGCPEPDNDGDGILDTADAAPNEPETLNGFEDHDGRPDRGPSWATRHRLSVPALPFRYGASAPSPEGRATLRALAGVLRLVPDLRVRLVGHADRRGAAVRNLRVSQARARAAARLLVAEGIARERIEVEGRGDREPVDPGRSRQARDRNRRVEVFLREATGATAARPLLDGQHD